ncbi:phosphoribosylanthranilate isomerase [Thiohalocapsa marina]|uniref:N-(5'-phosphoribosyl)anthranilate isomerase n=1 Tax=Thiohalocapsa marina TaxID=424902 RepID=A0A5M8FMX7_9GAMM|nr:phosphoribosylanthranilate isomerase [Thiohalocapsa marina]KAA6185046.1 phosphoribosylanthranilate isomerase [Thiohalocapsa marina]
MVRVKICGITDADQVDWCVAAGADCLGFVVEYPVPVPWNLSRQEAHALLARVPPMTTRALVSGGSPEHVIGLARALRPHLVQLHTDNTLAETAKIAQALAPIGIGLIRALRIDVATGLACGEITDPLAAAHALESTGVTAILLDARTGEMPAGTGVSLDWRGARRIRDRLSAPLILAGGLTTGNVRSAIEQVRPYAVDVISGVEVSRRVKSPKLIRQFVRQARVTVSQ